MTACPCGSGNTLDACCGPVIGGAPARTAEALMRSRYSAFVLGETGHLAATLSPAMRADFDEAEAADTCRNTQWLGLEVRDVTGGGSDEDFGTVEFVVRFRVDRQNHIHHEQAEFTRDNGRWMCSGGTMNPKAPPRRVVQVGRNDPCPCGSGKKYKKCCGA